MRERERNQHPHSDWASGRGRRRRKTCCRMERNSGCPFPTTDLSIRGATALCCFRVFVSCFFVLFRAVPTFGGSKRPFLTRPNIFQTLTQTLLFACVCICVCFE